jgi:hypothetical protein
MGEGKQRVEKEILDGERWYGASQRVERDISRNMNILLEKSLVSYISYNIHTYS